MDVWTDERLMKEVSSGSMDAMGILYERYKETLYTYFLRVTQDVHGSKDLLMTTFERLSKYKRSYNSTRPFRPWLFQIANNALRDNRNRKKESISTEISNEPVEQNTSVHRIEQEDRKKLLLKALEELPSSDRSIITMYYLLELSYEEIAEQQKISVNNARIRVCRSLKKLHTILSKTDIR